MKKILMMAAVILSSLSFMGIAEANVTAMRSEQNANGRTTVRFFGLTPGSEVQVATGNIVRSSPLFLVQPNLDAEIFRVSAPANATQVRVSGGSWINLSSIPDRTDTLRVATVQGVRQFQGRTANDIVSTLIPNSLGGFIKIGNAFYYRRPAGNNVNPSFEFNVPIQRVVRVNQCGFGSLTVITQGGLQGSISSLSLGGTNYNISSLPVGTPANLPRCIRFGETTFVRYNPQ